MLLCSQTNQAFAKKKKTEVEGSDLAALHDKLTVTADYQWWGRLPSYRDDDKTQQRQRQRYTNSSDNNTKLQWDTGFQGLCQH